jgi:hypothetical protein
MKASKTIYALLREDFASYSGFYYTRKDAERAAQELKVMHAWPTDQSQIVVFKAQESINH